MPARRRFGAGGPAFRDKTSTALYENLPSAVKGIDGTMITAWRGEQATTRRIAHVQSRGPCRLAGRKRKAPAASVAPGEGVAWLRTAGPRSEEHTSEIQSLM